MLKFKKDGKTVGVLKDEASEPEWLDEVLAKINEQVSPRQSEEPIETPEDAEEAEEDSGTV